MRILKKFWRKITKLVTGRTYFAAYDPGSEGDYSCTVYGYSDRHGVFHIVEENLERSSE